MPDKTYKIIEVVGVSEDSIHQAVRNALTKATQTLRNIDWFEVKDIRGAVTKQGEPVFDDSVALAAATELRKLDQQTIDLLGLAAPRRSVTATIELGLDERLAANEQLLQGRLAELMAENARLRRQLEPADVVDVEVLDEAG